MPFEADRDVPGLIVKFGDYPLHHGGVGAIRSLGRLGVPMYAITEDRYTPAASSRYLRRAFPWRTTGAEEPERLVEGMLRIARRIGRPTVLIPTDEEAAVLIAEHQEELADSGKFLFPRVGRDLPRRLASKQGLHELCVEHGVASPAAAFPESYADIEEFAASARFPVVAKNREAFTRRKQPAVNGTTKIATPEGLLALARGWGEQPGAILQEYLPREQAEDWIVHAYFDADSTPLALFTGVKVRSWPPHAGMTANAYVVDNPELADLAARFIKQIGFTGVIDLDLRFDRRDGQYKLLDFNPRMGAQFRLFESESGIDVVRAMHLDLTGRAVPEGTASGPPVRGGEHRPARSHRLPPQRIHDPACPGPRHGHGTRVARHRRPAAPVHDARPIRGPGSPPPPSAVADQPPRQRHREDRARGRDQDQGQDQGQDRGQDQGRIAHR